MENHLLAKYTHLQYNTMNGTPKQCPCGSGKTYELCCKPYHDGDLPENALQLMRSRYSAYALNLPDYIIATTHPASPQFTENKFSWKRALSQHASYSTYNKLEILDFKEKDTLATVIFTVYLTQENQQIVFTEKSAFQKIGNQWLYRNGRLAEGRVPDLITPGELNMLPIVYYGNPILRRKADPIVEITPDIEALVQKMKETMDQYDGLGLAAPQIDRSIRLFIIRQPIERDKDEVRSPDIKVFINPKLSSPSEETWDVPEGCLSIPTIRGTVKRPKEITVVYTSLDGNTHEERFKDWDAKAIMHENDHINGVLFIDRLESQERTKLEPYLKKLEQRLQKND